MTDELKPAFVAARSDDLGLPEYVAFNAGIHLPRMRRWELPFALWSARLENTASVLDCTINPECFHERFGRLYPHILYRPCPAIQRQRFMLPIGVPDNAFDCVVCVNTLEHLLAEQREMLIVEMARKLKPGGRLILAADYYFDSSWTKLHFLRSGVMAPDRRELFNGWNKLDPRTLVGSLRARGLEPLGDGSPEVPAEGDRSLYLNDSPYEHACIAGVFSKGVTASQASRRVVLSLLTWNTRAVSRDSLEALVGEAQMLRRLGHEAELCVVDNGSTDGTQEDLRAFEERLQFPHRFIYNPCNAGSSIARNQIVDHALTRDADYLLFIDGDIEVVPFSSFAMLRHLENAGGQLGCLGADMDGITDLRERASPVFYAVDPARVLAVNYLAWTQYGMFRTSMFRDGLRFDASPPFDGPGWGWEDVDLAFQIERLGYSNQRFSGMTYLHRKIRSSIRVMRKHGIDADAIYQRRRQYVLDKWATCPPIANGPLAHMRRMVALPPT